MRITKNIILFCLLILTACSSQQIQGIDVTNLRCESAKNPLGVEISAPQLSWEITSPQRGVMQTAYRVLVSDDLESLQHNSGNMWDSDSVSSDQSIQVAYEGKELLPDRLYYWKVMVWDNKGNVSGWSEPARWRMGLLSAKDWKGAKWIAYEAMPASERIVPAVHGKGSDDLSPATNVLPLIRKTFEVKKSLKRATLYISGLGHFEASLNGKKVGDHFLDPGWTDYDEHALYVTFNITEYLQQGNNAIGVMLGNGFYHIPRERYRKLTGSFGYPKMICRMVLEYDNGTVENMVSDASWSTAPGPITFSSIYGGEDYDARLEQSGWDTPDFEENEKWKPVMVVDGPPQLNSQMSTPVKVFENFKAQLITQPSPGKWVYDLGQNASGIIRLSVKGKKGSVIKIVPGELLNEAGEVSQKATGSPYYFKYILKGAGVETWMPRFSYYGFRYLQLEGGVPDGEANPANLPVVRGLKGLHIRNSADKAGEFSCSKPLFNKTQKLIDWAIRSNMVSVFTDCPHREKLGWLEQVHLMGNSVRYQYDIARMGRKIVNDMKMAQTKRGLIPNIAPEYVEFNFNSDRSFQDSPEWGSSGIIFPWYLYQWYGDKRVVKESYPMMKKYIAYLQSKAEDHILSHGLGDWYDLGPERPGFSQNTPAGVTATAIFYYDLNIMCKVAKLLNKPEDVKMYRELAGKVKKAFNDKFFNKETRQYATGSQTANAMAVYMDLAPSQFRDDVVNNIVKDIQQRGNRLTAGDIGYRYLVQVLKNEGRSDVIYAMNSRSDVPGYGLQLAKGATALTESWQALPVVSNNHFMLGHILEWFYNGLVGINPAENTIAFKSIDIKPEPVGDITSARASHHSPYGTIEASWRRHENTFELDVRIPANTSATVYLPGTPDAEILEDNKPVADNDDLELLGYKEGRILIKVGSGAYKFKISDAGI